MTGIVTAEYAPLVYSRTAYIDFRPDFLAAPAEMSAADRETAKQLVQAATDYADRLEKDGPRWVMFRAGDWLVAGVVAEAPLLSRQFTHERKVLPEGGERAQRLLFAFAGAAFRGSAAMTPPRDLPFYARIYESTVGPRFEEQKATTANWQSATDSPLEPIDLPAAISAITTPKSNAVEIWPQDEMQLAKMWATSAAGRGRPSLCTNAPLGKFKQWHMFDRISRQGAGNEPVTELREAAPAPNVTRAKSPARPAQSAPSMRPEDFVEVASQKKKSASSGGSGATLLLAAGAAVVALAAAAFFLRPR